MSNTNKSRSEESTARTLAVEKLSVMNRLGEIGVGGVADRLGHIGAAPAEVTTEQVKSGYATEASVAASFDDDDRVGVRVHLSGAPHGYVLVLFPMSSANNAATVMLSDAVEDLSAVPNEMAHDAVTELGGIVANGFLDAWADTFDQEVDAGAPSRVYGSQREILTTTTKLGEEIGLYIASRFHVPAQNIDTEVFVFPDTEVFLKLLELLDADRVTG
jgi:chemotaxis protein CheC